MLSGLNETVAQDQGLGQSQEQQPQGGSLPQLTPEQMAQLAGEMPQGG
jgi:hypothetical protein